MFETTIVLLSLAAATAVLGVILDFFNKSWKLIVRIFSIVIIFTSLGFSIALEYSRRDEAKEMADCNLKSSVKLIAELNNTLMYGNLLKDSAYGIREMRTLRSQISDLIKREQSNPVLKKNDFLKECWNRIDSVLSGVSFPFGGYDAIHISNTKDFLAFCVRDFTVDADNYLNANNNSFTFPPLSPHVLQHRCRDVSQYKY